MSDTEQTPKGDSIDDAIARLYALDKESLESQDQTESANEVEQETVDETVDEEVSLEDDKELTEDDDDNGDTDLESEESEKSEESEESEESEYLTEGQIEIDGESVSISEAKLGYLRQADYTKKTQALADQRKATEKKGETYESQMQALLAAAGADVGRFSNVNWEQAAIEDPDQYRQAKSAYTQSKQTYDFITAQVQEHEAKQQQDLKDRASESLTLLRNTIPNWSNDLYYAIGDYAQKTLGVSAEEYNKIADHRLITALYKAQQFDGAKAATTKKIKSSGKKTLSSKIAEPKDLGRKDSLRKARSNLKASGSVDDAIAALSQLTS
jgi:hypothetical protein